MWAHLWLLLLQFWHSEFMLGGMSTLLPVAAVDYLAFKNFQSFHEFAEYDWGIAAWRWGHAFWVGGLGATIFRAWVAPN